MPMVWAPAGLVIRKCGMKKVLNTSKYLLRKVGKMRW